VWGREFIAKDENLAGELEIKKHWYNFMLWGRLGYDNELPPAFFVDKIATHYPKLDAQLLHDTWSTASKVIPQVNRFYWKNWDYQWSVESCYNERKGFQTVLDFMGNPTMQESGIINPQEYAERVAARKPVDEISPLQVAKNLRGFAATTELGVKQLRAGAATPEAFTLLDDLLAMAYLGRYYADKMEAATQLALLQVDKNEVHRTQAIKLLKHAVTEWKRYAQMSEKHYRAQSLARTKRLDWSTILTDVEADVVLAEELKAEQ